MKTLIGITAGLFAIVGVVAALNAIPARSLPTRALATEIPVELTYGSMQENQYLGSGQTIALKNNGPPIHYLWVDCGFYSGSELVGANGTSATDVASGQTAYETVWSGIKADHAVCRVSHT